jgi:hypothetical protein
MTKRTFEFQDGPDAITATVESYGVSFRGRGPKGGHVSGPETIPTKALPGFLAFLAEHGLTDAELLNRSAEIAEGPLSSFDYELIADALDVLDPDGSEQTRRKQELEAWARQMAETGRGHLPPAVPGETAPPIRVVAALEGGIIQGAVADRPGVVLLTVDYDTDGEKDGVYDIPQGDDTTTAEAFRGEIRPEVDPAWIDGLQAARPSYGEGADEQLTETRGDPLPTAEQLRDRLQPAYDAAEEATRD